jgi:hypothetical protein
MAAPHTPFPGTEHFLPPEVATLHPVAVPELGDHMRRRDMEAQFGQLDDAVIVRINATANEQRIGENAARLHPTLDAIYGHLGGNYSLQGNYNAEMHRNVAVPAAQSEAAIRSLLDNGDTARLMDRLAANVTIVQNARDGHRDQLDTAVDSHLDAIDRRDETGQAYRDKQRERLLSGGSLLPARPAKGVDASKEEKERYRVASMDAEPSHSTRHFKAELASRKTATAVDAAVRNRNVSADQAAAIENTYDTINAEYTDQLEQLSALQSGVVGEMGSWAFGEDAASPDQAAHIATMLDEWREQLEGMSHFDSNRAESMRNWIVMSVRFQQRRAVLLPAGSPDMPRMTDDRGVRVNTPNGERVLYDDGSIILNPSDPDPERRWPDGRRWRPERPEDVPASTVDVEALQGMTMVDREHQMETAVANWELYRTPQYEVNAAVTAREHTRSLEQAASHYTERYTTADEAYATARTVVNNARTNRATEVATRQAELDPSDTVGRAAVVTSVNDRINQLQRAADDALTARDGVRTQLRLVREHANQAQYWRTFFAVTRPEQAGMEAGARAETGVRGQMVLHDTTINGRRGNWVLLRDGSARLHEPGGGVVTYAPHGNI